jgi:serine/threonine protein kinase
VPAQVVLKSAKKDDANLAREIHHHRQFIHPHIARLYEVIVTEKLVWLVLEYCPGAELYNYLLDNGPLPVEKVRRVFAQLVGAVCYVHTQSCVHRDLKLENILFDKHENVKLVDFGFTREYEGKANYLQTFCGTICYSAPEMLKGEKYAGEKVDVWSLGVILYALLCGELPFDDDDDDVTRRKILNEEPMYPAHMASDAQALCKALLSKRTLIRPSLFDILNHPFLANHSPNQLSILKLQQQTPFSTPLEKDTLQRMRSAGVNIDSVIESVLSQRCDALAGWWALLLEKEERKVKRREKKRREKEAEMKSLRRHSAASSRLDRMSFIGEDGRGLSTPRTRGRSERRSSHHTDLNIMDLPQLREALRENERSPDTETAPPPIDKDSVRSASSSRHRRPIPPPKEGVLRSARSRGSTLHLVATADGVRNSTTLVPINQPDHHSHPQYHHHQHHQPQQEPQDMLQPPEDQRRKVRKKPSQAIIAHWKNWTHWFYESTRRARGHNRKGSYSTPNLHDKDGASTNSKSKDASPRPHTSKYPTPGGLSPTQITAPKTANGDHKLPPVPVTGGMLGVGSFSPPQRTAPKLVTNMTTGPDSSYKRQSLSPSPITPRSTVRRSSTGLRGRKSTSSSVSSIRSIHHHHHTHSKASSTSSANSVSTNLSKTPMQRGHSPHHSVKMLPASPQGTMPLPSNIRLVRGKPAPLGLFGDHGAGEGNSRRPALSLEGRLGPGFQYNEANPPLGSPNPFSSGILFAKRKKNVFKGPMMGFGKGHSESVGSIPPRESHSSASSGGPLGRRSGDITIMEEEDEEFEDVLEEGAVIDEDVEEVDNFSPVIGGPGEQVEVYEEDDGDTDTVKLRREITLPDEPEPI